MVPFYSLVREEPCDFPLLRESCMVPFLVMGFLPFGKYGPETASFKVCLLFLSWSHNRHKKNATMLIEALFFQEGQSMNG